jgi:hypothetical protein
MAKFDTKKIINDIIFNGYGTAEFNKFDRRWLFKTLNAEEHQRLFSMSTIEDDEETNWQQYKIEMLKMAFISINDIEPSDEKKEELFDSLSPKIINELYKEYKELDEFQVNALSDVSVIDDIVKNSSYSKIRFKVMSKMGVLPTEKRAKDMNEYQWMWLYQNIIDEERENEEAMKARMDYLAFYINPEVAQKVREQEKAKKTGNKDGIVRVKKHTEVNPYNPNEVIEYGDTTVDEDFDEKLAMFMSEDEQLTSLDDDINKGNASESKEDFLSRVMANKLFIEEQNKQANHQKIEDDGLDEIIVKD